MSYHTIIPNVSQGIWSPFYKICKLFLQAAILVHWAPFFVDSALYFHVILSDKWTLYGEHDPFKISSIGLYARFWLSTMWIKYTMKECCTCLPLICQLVLWGISIWNFEHMYNHAKSSSLGCWASLFKYSCSNLNQNSAFHIINHSHMSTTFFHNSINLQNCQNFLIPHVIGTIPY